jgi:hypothetical protein
MRERSAGWWRRAGGTLGELDPATAELITRLA